MSSAPRPPTHGVVVPVKPVAVAKSRLAQLGDDARRGLVVAMVLDTVSAAARCDRVATVLVVTDDETMGRLLSEQGVPIVPDVAGDLNAALVAGATELHRRRPAVRPVALCGDLPALRPDALSGALGAAPADRPAMVSDLASSGTTLYTAPAPAFQPRFGSHSRDTHLAAGAVDLAAETALHASLRCDVDTPEDLVEALRLGVGEHTARVVSSYGLGVHEGTHP